MTHKKNLLCYSVIIIIVITIYFIYGLINDYVCTQFM
jgi:hypothetical protein